MSNHVTITGNLGQDSELRFTGTGKAVLNMSVGDTPRRLNPQTQQWEDAGETLWLPVTLWNGAEAASEALTRGTKVVATGRLTSRSWETKEGEKRTRVELVADTVAVVPKASALPRSEFGQQHAAADPWEKSGTASYSHDEPPF